MDSRVQSLVDETDQGNLTPYVHNVYHPLENSERPSTVTDRVAQDEALALKTRIQAPALPCEAEFLPKLPVLPESWFLQ